MSQDEHRFAEEIERILATGQERTDAALAELRRAEEGLRELATAEDARFAAEADTAISALHAAEAAERPTPTSAADMKLYDDTWDEPRSQSRPPVRRPAPQPAEDDEDFSERTWTS